MKEKIQKKEVREFIMEENYGVSPGATVSEISGIMNKHKKYALPIVKGEGYLGLVTASDIVSSRKPTTTKAENIASHIPLVSGESGLGEVLESMLEKNLRAVPVGEGGIFKGLITFWDVMGWCLKEKELSRYMVSDVKRFDFPKISADDELDAARVKLRKDDISKLFLGDDKVNSLIDEKEYATKISKIPKTRPKVGERVGEKIKMLGANPENIEESIVVQLDESDILKKLFEEMLENRTTHAKVGNGIVTYRDILRFLADLEGEEETVEQQKIKVISKHYLSPKTIKYFEDELRKFAQQYGERHGLETLKEMKINVKELNRKGLRRTYEMKANMVADSGNVHVKKQGWSPKKVFNELMAAVKKSVRRGS